jgi:hypothetical protein
MPGAIFWTVVDEVPDRIEGGVVPIPCTVNICGSLVI